MSSSDRIKCIECFRHTVRIDWDVPDGLDPLMKKYVCYMGHVTYVAPRKGNGFEDVILTKEEVNETNNVQ